MPAGLIAGDQHFEKETAKARLSPKFDCRGSEDIREHSRKAPFCSGLAASLGDYVRFDG